MTAAFSGYRLRKARKGGSSEPFTLDEGRTHLITDNAGLGHVSCLHRKVEPGAAADEFCVVGQHPVISTCDRFSSMPLAFAYHLRE